MRTMSDALHIRLAASSRSRPQSGSGSRADSLECGGFSVMCLIISESVRQVNKKIEENIACPELLRRRMSEYVRPQENRHSNVENFV